MNTMCSFFTFQYGDFADSTPNWFDWLSLVISSLISIFSVWGGFWIANRIYSNEKIDRIKEEKEIQESEVKLFRNSLTQLRSAINHQIQGLEEYLQKQDFSLKFHQGVQVDFLQFINIKYIYKDIGVTKQDEIRKINLLLSTLYTLNDFRISLRDEFRTYMKKYNFHKTSSILTENYSIQNMTNYVIRDVLNSKYMKERNYGHLIKVINS